MISELNEESFGTEVLQRPGNVLVDFFTPSCDPCRRMVPILEEIALERQGSLRIAKLDAARHGELAAQYRVSAVPALFLFRDGEVVGQRVGACSKKELVSWLDTQN